MCLGLASKGTMSPSMVTVSRGIISLFTFGCGDARIVSAYMYSYLEVRDNSVFGLVFNMKVTNWGWAVS